MLLGVFQSEPQARQCLASTGWNRQSINSLISAASLLALFRNAFANFINITITRKRTKIVFYLLNQIFPIRHSIINFQAGAVASIRIYKARINGFRKKMQHKERVYFFRLAFLAEATNFRLQFGFIDAGTKIFDRFFIMEFIFAFIGPDGQSSFTIGNAVEQPAVMGCDDITDDIRKQVVIDFFFNKLRSL
ncbi:hypothetical protein DSCA_16100 [Desulfosarcina alkanivorans]|uniref:Uncharacterized protein n=1 Tax=Desulfosarcina alkanivorans TaxID=571177 RepID=A0A5K7YHW5_9BACT|nr:hypothetical protein DSCA_16100 [Desulfosarcina alkanivorans]